VTGVASKATLAYHDVQFDVWRLKGTVPIVRAPSCGVAPRGNNRFLVICPRRSSLLRTELWFPGWTASVGGVATEVRNRAGMQSVSVPKGRSVVELNYTPPGATPATLAAIVALLALCVPWSAFARWRRRRAGSSSSRSALLSLGALPPGDASAPTGGVPVIDTEPATGSIGVINEVADPVTSAVPAVTGSVSAVTNVAVSSVATVDGDDPLVDPPTMAVPLDRPTPKPTADES
jgi:hypothetical protein